MRGWDLTAAVILLSVGGGCLATSVQASPFGPASDWLLPVLQSLRIALLLALPLGLIGLVWKGWRERDAFRCGCGYMIKAGWHYCPQCGGVVKASSGQAEGVKGE